MHHSVLVSMTGCMLCVCPVRSSTGDQEQRPVPPMWSRETQPGLALFPVITQTAAQHNGQQQHCGMFISRFWDIFVKFLWPKIERVFSSSIIEENIEKCRYFQWILIKMSFNLLVRLHDLDLIHMDTSSLVHKWCLSFFSESWFNVYLILEFIVLAHHWIDEVGQTAM